MSDEISNKKLALSDIPGPGASREMLQDFALTYNGYKRCRSEKAFHAIIHEGRENTLHELRVRLFFQQRSDRHDGYGPNEEGIAIYRGLVEKIRAKVAANERD